MNISAQEIAAIQADANSKESEGGLEHAILRWLNYPADEIIRHAGGKVPEYVRPLVESAVKIITAAKKSRGKTRAKRNAKAK